ncbi:MAG: hypothetical protein ACRC0L_08620, partial [Angustibacter sp.]
ESLASPGNWQISAEQQYQLAAQQLGQLLFAAPDLNAVSPRDALRSALFVAGQVYSGNPSAISGLLLELDLIADRVDPAARSTMLDQLPRTYPEQVANVLRNRWSDTAIDLRPTSATVPEILDRLNFRAVLADTITLRHESQLIQRNLEQQARPQFMREFTALVAAQRDLGQRLSSLDQRYPQITELAAQLTAAGPELMTRQSPLDLAAAPGDLGATPAVTPGTDLQLVRADRALPPVERPPVAEAAPAVVPGTDLPVVVADRPLAPVEQAPVELPLVAEAAPALTPGTELPPVAELADHSQLEPVVPAPEVSAAAALHLVRHSAQARVEILEQRSAALEHVTSLMAGAQTTTLHGVLRNEAEESLDRWSNRD